MRTHQANVSDKRSDGDGTIPQVDAVLLRRAFPENKRHNRAQLPASQIMSRTRPHLCCLHRKPLAYTRDQIRRNVEGRASRPRYSTTGLSEQTSPHGNFDSKILNPGWCWQLLSNRSLHEQQAFFVLSTDNLSKERLPSSFC